MIVQFKEGFLESLKEYGSGIRITTAFVSGSFRKFESLWSSNVLTFTIKGDEEERGPIKVYYSDYNDNKLGEAFIIGTYTALSCPEHETVYIKGVISEKDGKKYIDGILYEGTISEKGIYLIEKSLSEGDLILRGKGIDDKDSEDLILSSINYFNISFPFEVNANILSTYSNTTIKFLEDPYQIETCNIFKEDGIPSKETYEKKYRQEILSKNIIPCLNMRGENIRTSSFPSNYVPINPPPL